MYTLLPHAGTHPRLRWNVVQSLNSPFFPSPYMGREDRRVQGLDQVEWYPIYGPKIVFYCTHEEKINFEGFTQNVYPHLKCCFCTTEVVCDHASRLTFESRTRATRSKVIRREEVWWRGRSRLATTEVAGVSRSRQFLFSGHRRRHWSSVFICKGLRRVSILYWPKLAWLCLTDRILTNAYSDLNQQQIWIFSER